METNNLILVEQFCSNSEIKYSFIDSLHEHGIIEIISINENKYLLNEQLKNVEMAIRFHYELNINMEGIDVIANLLIQINDLKQELIKAKNTLSLFEIE
jgi:hypothetical protein